MPIRDLRRTNPATPEQWRLHREAAKREPTAADMAAARRARQEANRLEEQRRRQPDCKDIVDGELRDV